jgi:phosphatidylglycerol:prolipoprotein diacylglycerol transferase
MFPEVFHLGPLHLRSFGVMLAVAFLVGSWIALGEARRRGIDESKLLNLVLVILVSSIAGARGMYVLTHLPGVRRPAAQRDRAVGGGLTLYGGFALGTIAGFAYMGRPGCRSARRRTSSRPRSRSGVGIARIGCFLNGCCFGVPGDSPWCVRFPAGSPPAAGVPGPAARAFAALQRGGGLRAVRARALAAAAHARAGTAVVAVPRAVHAGPDPDRRTRYYEPSAYVMNSPFGPVTDSNVIGAVIFVVSVVLFFLAGRAARKAEPIVRPDAA